MTPQDKREQQLRMELMTIHSAKLRQDIDHGEKAEKREKRRFFWQVAGTVGGLVTGSALGGAALLTLIFYLLGLLK
jgi:hypothetical protein